MNYKRKQRLIIVTDSQVKKEFVHTIEDKLGVKVNILCVDSFWVKGTNKFLKHMVYFLFSIKSFRNRNKYKYIIFLQQTIAFYYSILTKFCLKHSAITLVSPLIYKQQSGYRGRIHKFLFYNFLSSSAINLFISFAKAERIFYLNIFGQTFQNKIVFVPFGTNMPLPNEAPSPPGVASEQDRMLLNIAAIHSRPQVRGFRHQPLNEKEKIKMNFPDKTNGDVFFFSGGTSNRDYSTLISAFEKLNEQLKISCLRKDVRGLSIPKNVEIIYNLYGNKFLAYMRKAHAVIITLKQIPISSGQLVLLHAMRMGKPIIITRHAGVMDYIDDKCAILVESRSIKDIISAVRNLGVNEELSTFLGFNANKKYTENFTAKNYAERIAALLRTEKDADYSYN